MKHQFEHQIFYSDTDAYKVMWHGSYLRLFEMGRVLWVQSLNENLSELEKENIILPVTNINISYKAPAKLNDTVIIQTELEKYTPLYAIFKQEMFEKTNNKLLCCASVTIVATDKDGKLYRKMPSRLLEIFKKALS